MHRVWCIAAVVLLSLPAWAQALKFNEIQLGPTPGAVVGDFNADGREDFLAVQQNGTQFHLQISSGTGTYTAGPTYTIPNGERVSGDPGYAVGDFNGDGKLDLVIITNGNHFYEYLGNGNGSFQAPSTHALGFTVGAIVAADVNHDSKMDLVMLEVTNSSSTFVTYLGDGSGGFTAGPTSPASGYSLFTGDFDGDGKVDMMNANCGPGGCNFVVSYGDGAGHFGSPTITGGGEMQFAVADVDGDGKSDIITDANAYINAKDLPDLHVHYGMANRTFQDAQIPTSQCTYGGIAVADFNGDHIPDLVFSEHDCSAASGSSAQVAFLAGQGNRAFGSEQTLFNSTFNQQPGAFTVLRANNSDSKPDFFFTQASGGGSASFLMVNETSGTFAGCNAPNSPTGFHVCSPASGSTVSSPVKFSIGASGSVPMRKVEVWVDGVKQDESLYAFSHYAFLDASIALSTGTHAVTLVAAGWDNSLQSKSFSLTVGSGSTCSPPTSPGINVCSPANGSTVSSPVAINAAANVTGTIYRFELWLGSTKLASVANSTMMQTSVSVPSGTHTLTFVARNTSGTRWTQSVTITVH